MKGKNRGKKERKEKRSNKDKKNDHFLVTHSFQKSIKSECKFFIVNSRS